MLFAVARSFLDAERCRCPTAPSKLLRDRVVNVLVQ
jgi:hypothetical protein